MRRVKKIAITVTSLVFLMVSLCQMASASTQASQYLNNYGASMYQGSVDGSVRIDFTVAATRTSTLVGISSLTIHGSDGTDETIQGTLENGLLRANAVGNMNSYTYYGTPGVRYYAYLTAYAQQGTGYDTRGIVTNTVTAPPPYNP